MKKNIIILGFIGTINLVIYGQNPLTSCPKELPIVEPVSFSQNYDPAIISNKDYDAWIENGWQDCGEVLCYRIYGGRKWKIHMFYKAKTYMAVWEDKCGEVEKLSAADQYPFKYTDYPVKYTKFTRKASLKVGNFDWDTLYFK